jgi:hypothetical protein
MHRAARSPLSLRRESPPPRSDGPRRPVRHLLLQAEGPLRRYSARRQRLRLRGLTASHARAEYYGPATTVLRLNTVRGCNARLRQSLFLTTGPLQPVTFGQALELDIYQPAPKPRHRVRGEPRYSRNARGISVTLAAAQQDPPTPLSAPARIAADGEGSATLQLPSSVRDPRRSFSEVDERSGPPRPVRSLPPSPQVATAAQAAAIAQDAERVSRLMERGNIIEDDGEELDGLDVSALDNEAHSRGSELLGSKLAHLAHLFGVAAGEDEPDLAELEQHLAMAGGDDDDDDAAKADAPAGADVEAHEEPASQASEEDAQDAADDGAAGSDADSRGGDGEEGSQWADADAAARALEEAEEEEADDGAAADAEAAAGPESRPRSRADADAPDADDGPQ